MFNKHYEVHEGTQLYKMKKGKKLEDLEIYQVAMEIGEKVWNVVNTWDYFNKKTLGTQFVEAADSIAFNISEGYGKYFYKENRNFCYYSRGSAKETWTASIKSKARNLISDEDYRFLIQKMESYFRLSFRYIKTIGTSGADNCE
jgi:four helix bundle protein